MKVLFINSSGFYRKEDGLYVYYETGKLLVDLNETHQVDSYHYELLNPPVDNLSNFNISTTKIKISPAKRYKNKIISYLIAYTELFFKMLKADVLYLFYPNSFRFTALFALLFNKKLALYVRGEKGLESSFSKYIFKKATFILTVSPRFTKNIKALNDNVFTIKPMIAYDEKDIIEEKIKTDKSRILYVGRVEKDKGSLELIKAIEKLTKKHKNKFLLTIVGNGELLDSLKNYVIKNNLSENVVFKGAIYDANVLKEIYQNNDIFIIPSHHEGFPRVLYEAMIFRLTIVTTFVGAISSIMIDKDNCLKIKVNDYNDISLKLEELLENPSMSEAIASKGTECIKKYLKINNRSHLDLIKDNLTNER
ncbi:glycosyltransferase family 4 protein [Tenacibaculum finnmarkense]|uniref:glycosyltransferase family 4 protein n=1 Tax=Tenacibaculum finnmarkense TaxID=2781243 RepID=UPI001E5A96F2|nr:glycosyltransferase family 4 protein [Tenacibaculum finnmarkense]MCD8411717.1 glycosyltransferase family 4 protein [Tenacibaculum finnmarkense genomovar ulcerans]MCD8454720.1 glycosyltransferase family 4 protein [Tenacibaculum finnmarkense genomovar ulcerans]MCG8206775.1 glycosyltransferase family 4 protein [Tenacibaculum finnmarkense genomovar finnmarkense]MCG8209882.1 glycosyltransferase family 4 protein [Tenacibaculum finnmarkense genomovar finnmarkense]MCG8225457.1 glycosyltransferase f